MDPFIGEIRLLPYIFAPSGWLDCNGQVVQVAQYQALYAIVGNAFGGTSPNTFGLPDLRGRVAVSSGDDPADSFDPAYGSAGGSETVALTAANIPQYTHTLQGATQKSAVLTNAPTSNYVSYEIYKKNPSGVTVVNAFYDNSSSVPALTALNPGSIQPYAGLGQGHENRQPYLGLRYCICWDGVYPPRP